MRDGKKKFNLTPRQAEVASLARKGESYKDIADKLKISVRSVNAHMMRLRDKTGAKSSAQLAYMLSLFRLPKSARHF